MVSAIITTYKRNIEIVERALWSIEKQTYDDIEILIVDDNDMGSKYTEELKSMCKSHPKVKYLTQNGNKGACSARNFGIANARGKYVAFLDDDDIWLPEKIEKQLSVIKGDERIGLVYCCGFLSDAETGIIGDYFNVNKFREEVKFEDLLEGDCIGSTSQPLIRKDVIEGRGGFWIEQPARQDYEMWIRISMVSRILGINEKLFIHYIHNGEQISKNREKGFIGYYNIYKRYYRYYKKNKKAKKAIAFDLYYSSKGIKKLSVYNFWFGLMWKWCCLSDKRMSVFLRSL